MCSERLKFAAAVACVVAATAVGAGAAGQASQAGRRFFPDDPISRDEDTTIDASGIKELELSESYDFLINTFVPQGDREPIRAVNVNTLDEVPDSSWFTNRIGVRDLPIAEITRGPNKFERLDAVDWVVVAGKSPGGFHPGFRGGTPGRSRPGVSARDRSGRSPAAGDWRRADWHARVPRARVSRRGRLRDQGGSGQAHDLRQGDHSRRVRAPPLQPARPRSGSAHGGARLPRGACTCRPRASTRASPSGTSSTTAPGATTRTTSTRTSTAASCGRTVCSPPGWRTTTRGPSTRWTS